MTREEWLQGATEAMRAKFAWSIPNKVQLSVGWPKGSRGKGHAIGQCWATTAASDGLHHIFISPVLESVCDPMGVLPTLVHELVHAAVGVEHGHKKEFKRLALHVGLEGKMTSTHAGSTLLAYLEEVALQLGPYPHGALSMHARKKQGTRLIKAIAPCCGYTVRVTQKWVDVGLPTCVCGDTFEVEGAS